jgi:hypothetical protein
MMALITRDLRGGEGQMIDLALVRGGVPLSSTSIRSSTIR